MNEKVNKRQGNPSTQVILTCVCGTSIQKREFAIHSHSCPIFLEIFGDGWSILDEYLNKFQDIQKLSLFKEMLEYYNYRITTNIKDLKANLTTEPYSPPATRPRIPPKEEQGVAGEGRGVAGLVGASVQGPGGVLQIGRGGRAHEVGGGGMGGHAHNMPHVAPPLEEEMKLPGEEDLVMDEGNTGVIPMSNINPSRPLIGNGRGTPPVEEEGKGVNFGLEDEDEHDHLQEQLVQCVGNCKGCFASLEDMLYLDCIHPICKEDLKNLIFKEFGESGSVTCPECRFPIQEWFIKDFIGEEKLANLQKKFMKKFAEQNGLVNCKCGNMFELRVGDVDPGLKNEEGKPVTQQAALHMSKNRARCPECKKNFCAKCKTEPYHLGYTCETFSKYQKARKCRFCREEIRGKSSSPIPAFHDVCLKPECQNYMNQSCNKILPCGHACCGFRGERQCLPCLNEECVKANPVPTHDQNEDSYCPICYTAGLGEMPSIMLECGHILHCECLLKKIGNNFPGPRITFFFALCPSCRAWVKAGHNPELTNQMEKVEKLHKRIKDMSTDRLKFEGLDKDKRLHDPKDRYYKKPQEYAMARLSYYMCFKCKDPYFGGLKACENVNEGGGEYKPEELVCGKCAAVSVKAGIRDCKTHGKEYIEFKCKFCCSVAQWFCWGNTHFCVKCHGQQQKGNYLTKKGRSELPKCPGVNKCPLKVSHPANGEEYALGCAICRNLNANVKKF